MWSGYLEHPYILWFRIEKALHIGYGSGAGVDVGGPNIGIVSRIARRFFPHYGAGLYVWPSAELASSSISPRKADTLPPIQRAVGLVSGDIARLPLEPQMRDAQGWEPILGPVADLLECPNEYQSGYEWRRGMARDLMIHGNAASLIRRTRAGDPIELIPMSPDSYQLHYVREEDTYYTHGDMGRLDPADVIHFRMPGMNPLWGDSPIVRCRASLDLLAEQEHTGRMHFKTGGIGKLSLSTDEPIGESAVLKLRQAVEDGHQSAGSISTPMILQGGMKAETLGATLSQAEWTEARNFSVRQVGMIYGIPPQLLFAAETQVHENTYTQIRAYVDGGLSHYAALIEGELARKLLVKGQRFHFDFRHLLRGSLDQVVAAARQAIDAGVMTQNEARELLGLPRHVDPIADALVFSKNYATGGMTENKTEDEGQADGED